LIINFERYSAFQRRRTELSTCLEKMKAFAMRLLNDHASAPPLEEAEPQKSAKTKSIDDELS
jgi:hypothetical protein